jgi:hypothetical protein
VRTPRRKRKRRATEGRKRKRKRKGKGGWIWRKGGRRVGLGVPLPRGETRKQEGRQDGTGHLT